MRKAALIALIALWLAPMAGATPRDDMTALIRAGDAEAVLAALATPDRALQRQSFAAFQTSDPAAGKVSETLLATHPTDPLAQTARGWHLLSLGWALRGSGYADSIYPEALAQMRALHGEAWTLAEAAVKADPTLVPASDLVLVLAKTSGHHGAIPAEFDRIMRVWPNRQSLVLAVSGMTPDWGGPADWGKEACATWGGKVADVEGYTGEVCALDILWAAPYSRDDQARAYDRLAVTDHPILDAARKSWAMSGLMPKARAIEVLEGFARKGDLRLSQAEMLDSLRGKGGPGVFGPARRAALKTEVPRLRAEADFDPANSIAISLYVDALNEEAMVAGKAPPRDEIDERFGRLFALAPYDGSTWARYALFLQNDLDYETVALERIDRVRDYLVNGVFYSNHDTGQLFWLDAFNRSTWDALDKRNIDAVDATGETAFPKAAFEASVVCPAIRTIRLLQAICAQKGGQGCPQPNDPNLRWEEQIARAEKRKACAAELSADPGDLLYTAVPVELPKD